MARPRQDYGVLVVLWAANVVEVFVYMRPANLVQCLIRQYFLREVSSLPVRV